MVKLFKGTHADRQIALLLFAGVFGLYLRTLAPDLLFGDSGEFQVAAWTLGLAHPTGYPLYLLLGSLWQHLLALFSFSPAYALNCMSAFFGALTVSLLYLTLIDWLQSAISVRRLVALLGALLLAVNPTFWSQSLIAEVYTLHAFFLILILHTAYQLMQLRRVQVEANSTAPEEESLSVSTPPPVRTALPLLLAFLVALSLTHHAMTLLLLPSLLIAIWWSWPYWQMDKRNWLLLLPALLGPLLLYLYIPLRSGPGPSPWYHQPLGSEPLTLFQNHWSAFLAFITGQSISVGFRNLAGAWAQLPQAWLLWRLHFFLPGLVMMVLGIYSLIRARNWSLLALTVPFFLLQQGFVLFYNIGDILVYYIPLYLIGAIWATFTVDVIGGALANIERLSTEEGIAADERAKAEPPGDWQQRSRAKEKRPPALALSMVLVLALFWLPFQLGRDYFPQLDQSTVNGARTLWDAIVDAAPPADAILISNDRNEIVPLFYYQAVEGKLTGITGLFPLIEPGARFRDIGATVTTALTAADTRPLYLIKPMPGLELLFDLQEVTPPLVAVQARASTEPTVRVAQRYGPLTLLGYDWEEAENGAVIVLYWQVKEALAHDYTTTVQLLDGNGEKVAQEDAPPGGRYYPTSRWQPGELLVERHLLATDKITPAAMLLVGMYESKTQLLMAPPLEIAVRDLP